MGRDPLLSERQAAEYLGMSPRYLQERRYRGGGPPYIRISHRTIKYQPESLSRWLSERSYTATCEEPSQEPAPERVISVQEPAAEPQTVRVISATTRVAGPEMNTSANR